MDAKPHNLKDIFDTQIRYMVPLYQRPYVWRKDKQWGPLWEDFEALTERYVRRESNQVRPHFMGAVVLDQVGNFPGSIDLRQVIDGQQRLTTLQILIEAAADICEALGPIAFMTARSLRRLTRNEQRGDDPAEVFKVWPTNVDREHFRRVMSAGSPEELRNLYDSTREGAVGHAIADGYFFLHDKLSAWLQPGDEALLLQQMTALENAIYRGLQMVVIDLDERDDAQVIFETMNARGTPLLAADLVKNYLLHGTEKQGPALDKVYHDTWEPFDATPFWRKEIRTGRFKRPHIEVFLHHYLTLRMQAEVSVTSLFYDFRQHLKAQKNEDAESHLRNLHRFGQVYYRFYEYPANTPEALFFQRMEALDTTTVFPLLLKVFDALGSPAHDRDRRQILTDIESYLVRRLVCELTAKNYNNLTIAAIKVLAKATPDQWAQELRAYLLSLTEDTGRWPDDTEFRDAWRKLEAYRRIKPQGRLRMILEALERQLRSTGLSEELNLPKKRISIEHVMPRAWANAWPLANNSPEARDAREALVHSFGNLTLVTGSMNSTLSNSAWDKKRKALNKHAVLLMNRDLYDLELWDETAIRKRGDELFKLAKKVWPRPPAA